MIIFISHLLLFKEFKKIIQKNMSDYFENLNEEMTEEEVVRAFRVLCDTWNVIKHNFSNVVHEIMTADPIYVDPDVTIHAPTRMTKVKQI